MAQSDNITVVVQNLVKTYRVAENGGELNLLNFRRSMEINALKGVSFVAKAGECIGVLGKNGSGKSTLMNLIAGSESPTNGLVRVSSQPTLLGVSAALQPNLSGRDNVVLGLLAMGLDKSEIEIMVPRILEWAELQDAADRAMKTYSSGMKARLKFAIATSVHREILLVDEALSTGDASFAAKARTRMRSFLESAGTVFIVSHASGTIRKHCNRVLWIYEGEIIADGAPKKILREYELWMKRVRLGNQRDAAVVINRMRTSYTPPQIRFAGSPEHQK